MADYVDTAAQTTIAGLAKHPSPFPSALSPNTTTTPPDDMPSKELFSTDAAPVASKSVPKHDNLPPSLLLRRKKRPPLVARISLPANEVEPFGKSDDPKSPPPTELMSPLPAANKLFAGHTPIFPRSLSPLHAKEDSAPSTPEEVAVEEEEEFLSGPLTLPSMPGDGAEDRIELKALDAELEKIAKVQHLVQDEQAGSGPSQTAEHGGQDSRKGSVEGRRRSSADDIVEVVDGVLLKKPKMNLGAPLGQI
ncbi:hypothetical protein EJ04DRAFT_178643 [Polyplosphaeria fusca]|uniref:Uncharacterized protein n=1 Tax=Polyplosphaeria fusca TaxID=682080 RepID=A0A9P4R0P9_9PLEO|nr:hypothetical protein EJ04DRAFT_178643 [Polyplosphaeria fusca]